MGDIYKVDEAKIIHRIYEVFCIENLILNSKVVTGDQMAN